MATFAGLIALVAPSLLGVLGLVVLVRWLVPPDEDADFSNRVLRWTIASFFAHLLFGLLITSLAGSFSFLRSDGLTYHGHAIQIVDNWRTGAPAPRLPAGKEGFYYLLAGLYWVFGAYPAAGLAVNAVLAAALVPVATDLTRRLFGTEASRYPAPLLVLMPGVFIWTSQLLKEAAVLLLIVVAASAAVRMSQRVTPAPLLVASTSLALLLTFRGPVGLVVTAGTVAGVAFGKREMLSGLGTGLSALALMTVLVLAMGFGYAGYQSATGSDLKDANIVRQDLASSARTGYDAQVDISTPSAALAYLPSGLVSFGLGPFPWQITGIGQLATAPDVVVWWLLLPSLWRGLRAGRRLVGRRMGVLILPALMTSIILALALGNFGTVVRERAQIVVLLVPFISLGLAQRDRVSALDRLVDQRVPEHA